MAMSIQQAVCFAILMQHGPGIIHKAPYYVQEKLTECELMPDPRAILDATNQALFRKWCHLWEIEEVSRE